MRIRVRAYAELVDLAGDAEVDVPVGERRSVKDLVESIGIPHPEIGLLLVDGRPVGFSHQLSGSERVAVYPPMHDLVPADSIWPAPPEPRRFVLDVHLGTLTRRLRLLGFDCWYRTHADDTRLADVAVTGDRILLTRDLRLLMRRVVVHGYVPRSDDPDEQALEVVRRYDLARRSAPFSRCIRCNDHLAGVARAEVEHELPPRVRRDFDRFSRCVGCGQVYWPGTHLGAMDDFLARVGIPDDPADAPGTISTRGTRSPEPTSEHRDPAAGGRGGTG